VQRVIIDDILKFFPQRFQNSHKGSYGKVLNIAGSIYYVGAAVLSSLSALKIGAGYVTLACPASIVSSVHSLSCDIPVFPLDDSNGVICLKNTNSVDGLIEKNDIISLGCGLSLNEDIINFVNDFVKTCTKPIVLDADGINALSKLKDTKLPSNSIITPHSVELSKLLNVPVEEINKNREKYAVLAAEKYQVVVVLKGHNTIVTNSVFVYKNETGNSALSKAGSGDVLTGIIAGLYAQCKNPFYAAVLGVYLHGLTAEYASKDLTEYSVLASNLLEYIPFSLKFCLKNQKKLLK
jgi:NAD(P)H-hydrate epimerase